MSPEGNEGELFFFLPRPDRKGDLRRKGPVVGHRACPSLFYPVG